MCLPALSAGMKVKIKSWSAVAVWKWLTSDSQCGIILCRLPLMDAAQTAGYLETTVHWVCTLCVHVASSPGSTQVIARRELEGDLGMRLPSVHD